MVDTVSAALAEQGGIKSSPYGRAVLTLCGGPEYPLVLNEIRYGEHNATVVIPEHYQPWHDALRNYGIVGADPAAEFYKGPNPLAKYLLGALAMPIDRKGRMVPDIPFWQRLTKRNITASILGLDKNTHEQWLALNT